jgi:hypothetical protein
LLAQILAAQQQVCNGTKEKQQVLALWPVALMRVLRWWE